MRFVILCLTFLMSAATASAHEVRPAIADFTAEGGRLEIVATVNGEAIAAGADLEGVQDTDAIPASDEVDTLRMLEPDALAERLRAMGEEITDRLEVTVDGARVPLALTEVSVGALGNTDLPRDTVLTMTGELPEGAAEMRLTWPAAWGMLVLRQQGVDDPATLYIEGGLESEPIALAGGGADGAWGTFAGYVPVGFEHIVPMGLDHILFVLGLFFLSPRAAPLLWQVSAFTLAHTVTLALGALGLVNVSGAIVEPVIAASIVYVAVENILSKGLSPWRPAVVFLFGLLHGLGFASVLQEFGLPQGQFIPALVGFNVGVEIGQLFVIALAFMVVWVALRVDAMEVEERTGQVFYGVLALAFVALAWLLDGPAFLDTMGASAPVFLLPVAALAACCLVMASQVDKLDAYRRFVAVPASAAIGAVGAYWFVERVFL